jgi:hypothetical protein
MRSLSQPSPIYEFHEARGIPYYAFFEDADGDDATAEAAIFWHLSRIIDREWGSGIINPQVLRTLPRWVIDRRMFFGDWYDMDRRTLKRIGRGEYEGLGEVEDPTYAEIEGRKQVGWWAGAVPKIGEGNYAYAFAEPVYSLSSSYTRTQELFHEINAHFLSEEFPREIITDWSSPELRNLSEYFHAGLEYWGVFLFTVYDPETRRLTVISASTTD